MLPVPLHMISHSVHSQGCSIAGAAGSRGMYCVVQQPLAVLQRGQVGGGVGGRNMLAIRYGEFDKSLRDTNCTHILTARYCRPARWVVMRRHCGMGRGRV